MRLFLLTFMIQVCLSIVPVTAAEKYALLIGVTEYEHARMNSSPLKYPEDDARAIAELLKRGGYTVKELLGKDATKAAIETELKSFSQEGSINGVVLIGMFGHGVQYEELAYFCPYDTTTRAVKDFKGNTLRDKNGQLVQEPDPTTMVSMRDILDAMTLSKAKNKVLLADCCREDTSAARGRNAFGSNLTTADLPEGTAALFACSRNEQAFEHDDWQHGAFTRAFLDQATNLMKDGKVTAGSLAEKIHDQVRKQVAKQISGAKRQTVTYLNSGVVDLRLDVNQAGTTPNPQGELNFNNGNSELLLLRRRMYRRPPDVPAIQKQIAHIRTMGHSSAELDFLETLLHAKEQPDLAKQLAADLEEKYPGTYFPAAARFVCELESRPSGVQVSYFIKGTHLVNDLDRLIELGPSYEYTLIAIEAILQFSDIPDHVRFEQHLDRVVEASAENALVLLMKGNNLLGKDYTKAHELLSRAIELDGEFSNAMNVRGYCRMALNRDREALEDFSRAIEIDPGYTNAIMQKSRCQWRLKQTNEAKATLEKCLNERAITYFDLIYAAGMFREFGQHDDAAATYEKAIRVDPSPVDAYQGLVSHFIEVSRIRDVSGVLERANRDCVDELGLAALMVSSKQSTSAYRSAISLSRAGRGLSPMRGEFLVLSYMLASSIGARGESNEIASRLIREFPNELEAIAPVLEIQAEWGRHHESVSVAVPSEMRGDLYLLTENGIAQVRPGKSVEVIPGLVRDADDNEPAKSRKFSRVICFYTGAKTPLGDEKWELVSLDSENEVIFHTKLKDGVVQWELWRK